MTELLYLPDNDYEKAFAAEVTKTRESDGYLVLDRTLFYKEGGGQPPDHGTLSWGGNSARVIDVQKEHGEVRHYVEDSDKELPEPGTRVNGEIDWERRYSNMRMHTAQHVLSKVVLDRYNATTAGNQIYEKRSRIDFKPVELDDSDVEKIENAANSMIAEALPVEKKMMSRDLVEERMEEGRINLSLIPDHIDPLRVVIIGDEDLCPCGGTHVDNIEEIGPLEIFNRVSKGENVERLEFKLEE